MASEMFELKQQTQGIEAYTKNTLIDGMRERLRRFGHYYI